MRRPSDELYINTYAQRYHPNTVRCERRPGKGRVLVALRNFELGETIFSESLLAGCIADSQNSAFKYLEDLVTEYQFSLEPIWYWCALNSVLVHDEHETGDRTEAPCSPSKDTSSRFDALGEKHCALNRLDNETFTRLKLLYKPEECDVGPEVQTLLAAFDLTGRVEEIDFEKTLEIWIHNAFDTSDQEPACALYFISSFISHSCLPNSLWRLDSTGTLTVSARMQIHTGDEITLSYLGEDTLFEPAFMRQEIIETTKSFLCTCPRCVSPADLSRGFLCPKCNSGLVFFHPDAGTARDSEQLHPAESQSEPGASVLSAVAQNAHCFSRTIEDFDPPSDNDMSPNVSLIDNMAAAVDYFNAYKPLLCSACSHRLTQEEYTMLLDAENAALAPLCSKDAEKALCFSDETVKTLAECSDTTLATLESQVATRFVHHWIAVRLYALLTYKCFLAQNYSKALQYCKLKIRHIQRLNVVPTGTLAWSFEELADLALMCQCNVAIRQLVTSHVVLSSSQLDCLRRHASQWAIFYREAYRILVVLFNKNHAYSLALHDKLQELHILQTDLASLSFDERTFGTIHPTDAQWHMKVFTGSGNGMLNASMRRTPVLHALIKTHFLDVPIAFECTNHTRYDKNYTPTRLPSVQVHDEIISLQSKWSFPNF